MPILITRRYLLHDPIVPDDQVAGVLGVKVLVGAVVEEQVRGPEQGGVHPDVLGSGHHTHLSCVALP